MLIGPLFFCSGALSGVGEAGVGPEAIVPGTGDWPAELVDVAVDSVTLVA